MQTLSTQPKTAALDKELRELMHENLTKTK